MDAVQLTIIIALALIAGSIIGSYVLVRFPGSRAWIQNQAIKGYNYLDKVKPDVPPELMPTWTAAYNELDAVIDGFGDDDLKPSELRHMITHGLELINEIRKIIKK